MMSLPPKQQRLPRRFAITVLSLSFLLLATLLLNIPRSFALQHRNLGCHNVTTDDASGELALKLDCENLVSRGDAYGGWTMCTPLYSLKDQLVYTIGVGRNIKWDEAIMQEFHTIHHGWDPTPTAQDFFSKRSIPSQFYFHNVGLAAYDGSIRLKLPEGNADSYTVMQQKGIAKKGTEGVYPVLTLQSMMRHNHHDHLAILKIDVEGAEFEVIKLWHQKNAEIAADQVLIEFHGRYFDSGANMVREAVKQMAELGFMLVHRTNLVRNALPTFGCSILRMTTSVQF